jgi:hypothetical protein
MPAKCQSDISTKLEIQTQIRLSIGTSRYVTDVTNVSFYIFRVYLFLSDKTLDYYRNNRIMRKLKPVHILPLKTLSSKPSCSHSSIPVEILEIFDRNGRDSSLPVVDYFKPLDVLILELVKTFSENKADQLSRLSEFAMST